MDSVLIDFCTRLKKTGTCFRVVAGYRKNLSERVLPGALGYPVPERIKLLEFSYITTIKRGGFILFSETHSQQNTLIYNILHRSDSQRNIILNVTSIK